MPLRELLRLGQLPLAVHGEVLFSAPAVAREEDSLLSVCIDSRECSRGSLFFALPGARTDGHRYVQEAISRGAVAAVVSSQEDPLSGQEWAVPVVCVQDVLTALHQLASWYCKTHLAGPVRIGVTGSNGKTTTKEMIASILRCAGPTSSSFGNLNSETGLPLAVFQTDPDARYAVYEMAMSNPGEMEVLADIVRPDLAVITNIGEAHIGNLGSQEAIAREKKAIASRFDGPQRLIIPEDDPFSAYLREEIPGEVLFFGMQSQKARLEAGENPGAQRLFVDEECYPLPLEGAHNGRNALAAVAVAQALGIGSDCVRQGFQTLRLPSGRSELLQGKNGGLVLNDCYNANPESCIAALETVAAVHSERQRRVHEGGGRLVLILGELAELGAASIPGHRRVLERALSLEPDLIILVGVADQIGPAGTASAWDGLEELEEIALPPGRQLCRFPSVQEALAGVPPLLAGGETILLKGSRSVQLERLLPELLDSMSAGTSPGDSQGSVVSKSSDALQHLLNPEDSDDA
ncbi:UDP-N-acetylmuramoyl-tripeptide--D-alanyl-D-alanine ligase [Alkalispirochaeta americana]|uniref:UDP-N-acetylmuramoyl-tripeptide--D-alanyl-D-alanine ligase n=1 Tax=Alkalispirochaeta americana TaxID=159291 RepID=A0A1N6PK49_9SPIO|nr:UDP-N-acetylmuramoyl-tripeptide--D-alanyl-D-alanine ligase [Alkalispirochaeta americana]SIQ04666.1 UDP-N-acetylmuramoyl-tripeptide--D-alanyl-D-alanine ligase [Alkalispirochaeta americana]